MIDLDQALLDAHATGDKTALVSLYTIAADNSPDIDAEAFYLTHAYIFALDIGDAKAVTLKSRLTTMGRDLP